MKAFETLETIKVGTYIYNTASTGKENVIVGDAMESASRPKSTWTYLYTDTKTYNIDMDIYRTEDGKLVAIDSDWMFD